ncbi:MAG: F0F1 ATP synthase subunit delta [Opitutales bacterium]|nr:F0F1 ATP synthase subunit delta [Opitutales bacterium]
MKVAKAKVTILARKLTQASLENGAPAPQKVSAVLEALRKLPKTRSMPLLKAYLRLMRRAEAMRTLTIERAGPLSAGDRKVIVDSMSRKSGLSLNLVERENDALIGGLKVRLGDDEYDASIAGMLARL